MPEIVEVKKFADMIWEKVGNKSINKINFIDGRYKKHGAFKKFDTLVFPIVVTSVGTRGKLMYIGLNCGSYLVVTLGLSGGFIFIPTNTKHNYDNLNVEFETDGGKLYMYDQLSFGTITLYTDKTSLDKKLGTLGPDLLDETMTYALFKSRIHMKKNITKKIGLVLVDQKVISGVGNYLRADILWLSKISPMRLVNNLTETELQAIYTNAVGLIWGDYNKRYAIDKKIIKPDVLLPEMYGRLYFIYSQKDDVDGKVVTKEELYEGAQVRYIYWVKEVQK